MKKKIAIVYGGYSSEAGISEKSAGIIFQNIDDNLYKPYMVEITENSWHVHSSGGVYPIDKNKFTFFKNEEVISFDLAYIIIHGTPGEDGKLQAYFDMLGIPYVNSNAFAASLSFNKWACNSFLNKFGVRTAKAILLRKGDTPNPIEIADELGFPCFVKPNDGGSSFGISKVKTLMEMPLAIAKAFEEGNEVVIEEALTGREITCGIYQGESELIALPPTEILTEQEFFDYAAKYEGASNEVTPAEISEDTLKNIHEISKNVYRRLGLFGLARIDYIVLENELPHIIEVNSNPGMSEESIVPQQLKAAGKDLKETLSELVKMTLKD
ncbi:MAG: D-alanine--D-alanine ligase [Crocinitomicaceae bacterium]|nr:D-alanine--D-alanine ligase [Crocinitomicaceae bacterium]